MQINLKYKDTGVLKTAVLEFSWTTLLFCVFVPLTRGDVKWFFLSLAIAIFTMGIGWFFYSIYLQ